MNRQTTKLLLMLPLFLVFSGALSAQAQIEKVVADARGITWASCAAVMELALKRLDGVDKVTISIERQQFSISYKPGAIFQPAQIREAVAQTGVEVKKFHIQIRGKVEKSGDGRVLNAGKEKYAVAATSIDVPQGSELFISGDVTNDRKQPVELRIIDFKPTSADASIKPSSAPTSKAIPPKN